MGGGTNAVGALVTGLFTTLHNCTLHSRWTSKLSYGIKQLLDTYWRTWVHECAECMVSTAELQALVRCKMKRQMTINRYMLSVCMLTALYCDCRPLLFSWSARDMAVLCLRGHSRCTMEELLRGCRVKRVG